MALIPLHIVFIRRPGLLAVLSRYIIDTVIQHTVRSIFAALRQLRIQQVGSKRTLKLEGRIFLRFQTHWGCANQVSFALPSGYTAHHFLHANSKYLYSPKPCQINNYTTLLYGSADMNQSSYFLFLFQFLLSLTCWLLRSKVRPARQPFPLCFSL